VVRPLPASPHEEWAAGSDHGPSHDQSLPALRVVAAVVAVLVVTAAASTLIRAELARPRPSVLSDQFDRAGSGLGTTAQCAPWETPTPGRWAAVDGEAAVSDPNPAPGGRTLALVDLGSGNGSVQATIGHSASGWGLVFRYRSPTEYWVLTASPRFASFNLIHISGGKAEVVDRITLARQVPGTVVAVRFEGPQVTVRIDDRTVTTGAGVDPVDGAHRVGLVLADGSSTEARWRSFEARRLPRSPMPEPVRSTASSGRSSPSPEEDR
jgi:hypothetical protein